MSDLDLERGYRNVEENNMKDAMIRASNKAGLTINQLMDICFKEGALAIYNLGMEHMYDYLNE